MRLKVNNICKWKYSENGDLYTECDNRVSIRVLMGFLEAAIENFGDNCPFCRKIVEEIK